MCEFDLQSGFEALQDLFYQLGPEYERRLVEFATLDSPQDEFFIEAEETTYDR